MKNNYSIPGKKQNKNKLMCCYHAVKKVAETVPSMRAGLPSGTMQEMSSYYALELQRLAMCHWGSLQAILNPHPVTHPHTHTAVRWQLVRDTHALSDIMQDCALTKTCAEPKGLDTKGKTKQSVARCAHSNTTE